MGSLKVSSQVAERTLDEKLDGTGKIVLDGTYQQPDPRHYLATMKRLDYVIPQNAKPVFRKIIDACRRARGVDSVKIVDVGCSYGINAALLKWDLTMSRLFDLYGMDAVAKMGRRELIARDRQIYQAGNANSCCTVIGIDNAPQAAAYAKDAGIIDGHVTADLEQNDLKPCEMDLLDNHHVMISTGCVGYISEKTICAIVDANARRPWLAHFVLRMFSFESIAQALSERGYVTERGTVPYRQRRFATVRERDQVIDNLMAMGTDPADRETDGWLYADLYVSRPAHEAAREPCARFTT